MKTTSLAASLFAVSLALLFPAQARAQCRTIVVRGPGVRVVAPCLPPPPVVVRVVPAPPPPPTVPAPPAVPAPPQAPCVTPPPPPPARVVRRAPRPRIFTVGVFAEGTLFKDGGLGGAAVYAQFRLARGLHLFTSLGANSSCTNCNSNNPTRADLKATVGLQYYFVPRFRLSPYLRGSLVYQSVHFQNPDDPSDEIASANQVGVEAAAGLELKILRWLILGADVGYVGLRTSGEVLTDGQSMPAGNYKGLATLHEFDHGASFRLNLAIRF